jgi:hypothetical protein
MKYFHISHPQLLSLPAHYVPVLFEMLRKDRSEAEGRRTAAAGRRR